jgi:hypothetical protein
VLEIFVALFSESEILRLLDIMDFMIFWGIMSLSSVLWEDEGF